MEKVGIMTFHFSDNYGAVLQCYALRTVINRMKNHYAEVINFNPGRKVAWYTNKDIQKKFDEKLRKYAEFNQYANGIQGEEFFDINELKQEDFDCFVVGSDQIWNPSFSFFSTAYLLDFVKGKQKKISYAASVGLAVDSPRMNKDVFAKYIPQFDFLSVREKTHQAFIESFTDKKVQTVLDPTLLLTCSDYDTLIEETELQRNDKQEDEYIFFYYLKHDATIPLACSFVNMLSRKYNLKIVHFCIDMPEQVFKNENKSFFFDGPKEFVWYVKHAKIVVTNSFHGTVFSILYHKPFYTYIVKSMASRVLDLLDSLGLENRLIRGYKPLNEVTFDIDFNSVDILLENKRKKSIAFLQEALGDVIDE